MNGGIGKEGEKLELLNQRGFSFPHFLGFTLGKLHSAWALAPCVLTGAMGAYTTHKHFRDWRKSM